MDRVKLSSARLFVELETELDELSTAALRPPRVTSGRLSPKRAMPALGELSICLEETSMEISVRREEAASGLRPPDSSMRLMPAFGERGLEDSEGDDLVEEWSEFRELKSKLRWLDVEEVDERSGLVVRRVKGEGCVDESASSTSNDLFSAGKKKKKRKTCETIIYH